MTQKVDRRVRRTRRLLSEAVLELLLEKEYETITVNEITDRADLNRATFYLHYGSKEELLIAALEEKFDALVATMEGLDQISPQNPIWSNAEPEYLTFKHVEENAALYKVLLGERGVGYVAYRILDYITEFATHAVEASLPEGIEAPLPVELVGRHYAGTLFSLLSWWVIHDMPYPPEFMAQAVYQLCSEGSVPASTQEMIKQIAG